MIFEEKIDMQLVCFSHLPWKFVYQRPQHLLTRFTKKYEVYYIEEFIFNNEKEDGYSISIIENVKVIVPNLSDRYQGAQHENKRKEIVLKNIFREHVIDSYLFWYYTPMALAYTANFNPVTTVYDCMDELSAFKFAPPELKIFEQELFNKADVVFTGGHNLYKAKKSQHHNIHAFPSSIDKAHFNAARNNKEEIAGQAVIDHQLQWKQQQKQWQFQWNTEKKSWNWNTIFPTLEII